MLDTNANRRGDAVDITAGEALGRMEAESVVPRPSDWQHVLKQTGWDFGDATTPSARAEITAFGRETLQAIVAACVALQAAEAFGPNAASNAAEQLAFREAWERSGTDGYAIADTAEAAEIPPFFPCETTCRGLDGKGARC